ncbi:GST-like protein [Pseudorhizobium tarimense]|uniref:GST-like protein n=1 Tax=Pseudorhizobium tarimense TaxID=1079109 RepID=A0ABV2HBM6_9HYPH|nr:glutathione S-transferase N-terminal domain-containing protein [Pseudorhizobium tarimense]MCJ8520944.1 glutathione S-transferase N-terminal domain-containing protein [Pseudorhizobium tarimense]
MIDLYTWKTANCQKVNIAVCELDLEVAVHPVDINAGDQKAVQFLAINPNAKVPAIADKTAGVTLSESGAILLYLAGKTGRLVPQDEPSAWRARQWIFWQMSALGPTAGLVTHFRQDRTRGDYALTRFSAELSRQFKLLDLTLKTDGFVAGDYSMADIAIWPWIARFKRSGMDLEDFPSLLRWYREIAQRPAVNAGYRMLNASAAIPIPAETAV